MRVKFFIVRNLARGRPPGQDGPKTHDSLNEWTVVVRQVLATDLGVEIPEADVQVLLDVARDAAHAVDRW